MESDKKKKPRFSKQELEVLVEGVKNRSEVIHQRFSDVVSNSKKKDAWNNIAADVSAISFTKRSSEDVKKRWDDLKRSTKKRFQETKSDRTKTGGGKLEKEPLTQMEEDVISIMGEERVAGFSGGVDTMAKAAEIRKEGDEIITRCEPNTAEDPPQMTPTVNNMCQSSRTYLTNNKDISFCSKPQPIKESTKKMSRPTFIKTNDENESLEIQRQILVIEKERLYIERERLGIEKRRLELQEMENQYKQNKRQKQLCSNPSEYELFSSAFSYGSQL